MSEHSNQPEILLRVRDDMEAAMIVSSLAAEDIDATSTGGFTAGFLAEAPGEVSILVRNSDLARARLALTDIIPNAPEATSLAPASSFPLLLGVILPVLLVAILLLFLQ